MTSRVPPSYWINLMRAELASAKARREAAKPAPTTEDQADQAAERNEETP